MRILAVCGMGVGSSLLLRMQAEKALSRLGVKADFDVADIGTARGASRGFDLVITTAELAERLAGIAPPIVVVSNFLDMNEFVTKLGAALDAMGSSAAG